MATQALAKHVQKENVVQFSAQSVDAELEAKLNHYLELKALNSEYNRLSKELKGLFENTPSVQVGKYTITGQLVYRDGYQVQAFSYWDWKVTQ